MSLMTCLVLCEFALTLLLILALLLKGVWVAVRLCAPPAHSGVQKPLIRAREKAKRTGAAGNISAPPAASPTRPFTRSR